MYAALVLPVALNREFTYSVPEELQKIAEVGKRAAVPFGKRIVTGFIVSIRDESGLTDESKIKPIEDIIDEQPVFDSRKFRFYKWISDYYLSTLYDALRNSDPYGTAVKSETHISPDKDKVLAALKNITRKNTLRFKILEWLSENGEATAKKLQKIAGKSNIGNLLRELEKEGVIEIKRDLEKPKTGHKTVRYARLTLSVEDTYEIIPMFEKKSPRMVEALLKLIGTSKNEAPVPYLTAETGITGVSLKKLEEKGIIRIFHKKITRKSAELYNEEHKNLTLNSNQQNAVGKIKEALDQNIFKTFLLHGVTGSGKTQVYIELIKEAIKQGKNSILLVPEISLTPQMSARLINNFGDEVAIIHSRLKPGERHDTWYSINSGKVKVVTGARSALFAPFQDIGLIIVDEEHDSSYKQDEMQPYFQARDCAIMLGSIYNAPVVLGSATPSMESMYNAGSGKYELLNLPERVDGASLPEILLVNITDEKKNKRMENVYSRTMLEKIDDRLKKKEGIIILQNRRGFATQAYCFECGQLEMCENCSVSLVHHIKNNTLVCHYCGFKKSLIEVCSHCGSKSITFTGTGTEKVEDELEFYFPGIRTGRVDSDSVAEGASFSEMLNDFREGKLDVLVGTQMVSKGLDIPRVTLVCVISAETNLWMPDFRADERTFQLLTQVSGRSGRSTAGGEVVIQTQNDKNFVLQKVLMNDYKGFYEKEIASRKVRKYPPFANICLVEFRDKNEEKARELIIEYYKILSAFRKYAVISPPTNAVIAKLRGEYRFQVVLKTGKDEDKSGSVLREVVKKSYDTFLEKHGSREIRITLDFNPYTII
ncbi:MAG: primosomal protein N' [Ignavibacteriaceae bacterium]|nr:primosomal protein N' [Ignavibacteriaceae bacterium]